MRRAWAAAAMLAALAFAPAFAAPSLPPVPSIPPELPAPPVPVPSPTSIPPELPAPPVPVPSPPSIPPELPAPPLPTTPPAPSGPAGCAVKPGPADGEATCSYLATGEGRYLAATQAYWSITVYRTQDGRERVVFLDEADPDDVPLPQQLPTVAGDRVVLIESTACPAEPAPCGIYGMVAAYEPHR